MSQKVMDKSRQQTRRKYFTAALMAVNSKNLRPALRRDPQSGLVGMSRSERRNLARAYAAHRWRTRAES